MIMKPKLAILTVVAALAATSCSSPKAKSARSGELILENVQVTITPETDGGAKRAAYADPYFKHPGAILVAKWKDGRCSCELTRTFVTPAPDPDYPESAFRFGCGFGNGDGIFWEFVHKTEHGDVYIFKRGLPESQQVLTPVLFAGVPLTVVAEKNLQVQILPPQEQAAK